MSKTWLTRIYDYLTAYPEDTHALIVATPLVRDDVPPKPLTIVVPVGHVTGDVVVPVRKPRKKAAAKRKRSYRK